MPAHNINEDRAVSSIQEPAKRPTTYLIRRKLRRDERLTEQGPITLFFILLEFINNQTGECFPSLETLSKETRIKSRTTLLKHLNTLERLGYIRIHSGKTRKSVNTYTVLLGNAEQGNPQDQVSSKWTSKASSGVQQLDTSADQVSNHCDPGVQSMDRELTQVNLDSPSIPQTGDLDAEQGEREIDIFSEDQEAKPEPVHQQSDTAGQGATVHHLPLTRKRWIPSKPRIEEISKEDREMISLLNHHFGGNIQNPDRQAIHVAKELLAKYAGLDTTPEKLDADDVEAWIERFWSEKGLRKLSPEAAHGLANGLVEKLTPAQFQVACQKIKAGWQPYWRNAPSLQSIIDAGTNSPAAQGSSDAGRIRMLQGLLDVCLRRRPDLAGAEQREVVAV
ncbi:hypothetical protein FIU85_21795 (plasmid) [Roseovarius sp. THAF8]|nr:hypothetical protein FIU85_21795 [Roseovarius sp. THAF8]